MSNAVIFVGDCTLEHQTWDDPPISDNLLKLINSNISVANLEGSIATQSPIEKAGPIISISESFPNKLRSYGFDVVTLANNHMMDFGPQGMIETIDAIDGAGLRSTGAGSTISEAVEPAVIDHTAGTIGIWSFAQHAELPASENSPGTANIHHIMEQYDVESWFSSVDVPIAVVHGGIEYSPIPPISWRRTLRSLAEKGAMVIIGHHPHCPQGWEDYEDTRIYYSLGNFMMYRENKPSTHWSLVPEVCIDDNGRIRFDQHITEVCDGVVHKMDEPFAYESYLADSSHLISSNENFKAYWNNLAMQLYEHRYRRKLDDFGRGTITSIVTNPIGGLDRLTRGVWGSSIQPEQEIQILDIVHNRSHLDAIQTALEIKLNHVETPKDDEIEAHLTELFNYSGNPVNPDNRSWYQRNIDRVRTALERLT